MENIARSTLIGFGNRSGGAKQRIARIRWRRVLLELCVLAAYILTTSLIARG
jgi:hypothetical protein